MWQNEILLILIVSMYYTRNALNGSSNPDYGAMGCEMRSGSTVSFLTDISCILFQLYLDRAYGKQGSRPVLRLPSSHGTMLVCAVWVWYFLLGIGQLYFCVRVYSVNNTKKHAIPDAFVILFVLLVLAWLFSYVIPSGSFSVNEDTGIVEPGSYSHVASPSLGIMDIF